MKIYLNSTEDIFGMADLAPNRTGLKLKIWVDHGGCQRSVSHNHTPRVKVGSLNNQVPVLVDDDPRILIDENQLNVKDISKIKSTFPYISRNADLFKKHYFDIDDEFDDRQLQDALAERGDFKL